MNFAILFSSYITMFFSESCRLPSNLLNNSFTIGTEVSTVSLLIFPTVSEVSSLYNNLVSGWKIYLYNYDKVVKIFVVLMSTLILPLFT